MKPKSITPEIIDKLYAGWISKAVGVRLGAPVEGWSFAEIRKVYGEIDGYVESYRNFAADDDTNVPVFLIRALDRLSAPEELTSQDIAHELMNASPYEHGFFWWGGYGISTEHTAYLNLMNGIAAPASGSILQNGSTVAEQIGGQIFIDVWGLVCPGAPEKAAVLAEKAARVTHDGNAVYGGIFIACCISIAYEENDVEEILKKALRFIPADCEYARVVRAVMQYHQENPDHWEQCFRYVLENWGYDRYPGNCHIIPNAAVIILALLYGKGDYDRTLNIGTMCGWDTDCNVGNIAAIMGVRGGTAAISYEKWLSPIQDLMICSGTLGSLNMQDNAQITDLLLRQVEKITGENAPEPLHSLIHQPQRLKHFEYPGSIQAMRARVSGPGALSVSHTRKKAFSGTGSLCIAGTSGNGLQGEIYQKTYYFPSDFSDSRYDPAFSPILYPGQTLRLAFLSEQEGTAVSLFVRDSRQGILQKSDSVSLSAGKWHELVWKIPADRGLALIDEAGLSLDRTAAGEIRFFLDDFYWTGTPDYEIRFERENLEDWRIGTHPGPHFEISQFTRWKGILFLENGELHLTGAGDSAAFTGDVLWKDYTVEAEITPLSGSGHYILFRAQGAMRGYAFGLCEGGAALLKNENGWRRLKSIPFSWEPGDRFSLRITVEGSSIRAQINGEAPLFFEDEENCCDTGCIGLFTTGNGHLKCSEIKVF